MSDWQAGATWEITLKNTDQENPVSDLELQILLPGVAEVDAWAMVFEERLPLLRASLPEWHNSLEPGGSYTFGFNIYPAGQPCRMRILSMAVGGVQAPAEEFPMDPGDPTSDPVPTPSSGTTPVVSPTPVTEPYPVDGAPPSPPPAPGVYAPPLRAEGSDLVNSLGEVVLLRGINWFGFETHNFVAHGLWARNWKSMVDQATSEGFNLLRLPYGQDLLIPNQKPKDINYDLNPDLVGLSALQVMDKIIAYAQQREMYVVLDRHTLRADERTELWYTGDRSASPSANPYSEEAWIQGMEQLADRYRGRSNVIGFDLHNEPHGRASWGSGDINTDWRLAAQRAGNRLLKANGALLVIVEGVQQNVNGSDAPPYWWGGNLSGVKTNPVVLSKPGRVVYSPHDYGPGVYAQTWFYANNYPQNLPGIWETYWSYILEEDIAPVLIGEFGGWSVDPEDYAVGSDPWREAVWQQSLVEYQLSLGLSGVYWCLNPNSLDTGGYLHDDWQTVVSDKRALLQPWVVR